MVLCNFSHKWVSEWVGLYAPVNTKWIILETSLSRQSSTLVLTTKHKEPKLYKHLKNKKNQPAALAIININWTLNPGSVAFYDIPPGAEWVYSYNPWPDMGLVAMTFTQIYLMRCLSITLQVNLFTSKLKPCLAFNYTQSQAWPHHELVSSIIYADEHVVPLSPLVMPSTRWWHHPVDDVFDPSCWRSSSLPLAWNHSLCDFLLQA